MLVTQGASASHCPVSTGQTVQSALADMPSPPPSTQPTTVVLIRRGPDGIERTPINCTAGYQVLDPKQNQNLKNGDQLLVPMVSAAPNGLARPALPGIPVSQ
jgi:hypothetical protein